MSTTRKKEVPEGYICRHRGSFPPYCTPGKCPAKDVTCGCCDEIGHYSKMCSLHKNKEATQPRCDESTHKRSSENSPEAASKRPKEDPSIDPTPLVPENGKIYDCEIGNRQSGFKIGEANPVNIISEKEYKKLSFAKFTSSSSKVVQLHYGSNLAFNLSLRHEFEVQRKSSKRNFLHH